MFFVRVNESAVKVRYNRIFMGHCSGFNFQGIGFAKNKPRLVWNWTRYKRRLSRWIRLPVVSGCFLWAVGRWAGGLADGRAGFLLPLPQRVFSIPTSAHHTTKAQRHAHTRISVPQKIQLATEEADRDWLLWLVLPNAQSIAREQQHFGCNILR